MRDGRVEVGEEGDYIYIYRHTVTARLTPALTHIYPVIFVSTKYPEAKSLPILANAETGRNT